MCFKEPVIQHKRLQVIFGPEGRHFSYSRENYLPIIDEICLHRVACDHHLKLKFRFMKIYHNEDKSMLGILNEAKPIPSILSKFPSMTAKKFIQPVSSICKAHASYSPIMNPLTYQKGARLNPLL